MLKNILLVALGGGIGSVFRYLTNIGILKFVTTKSFYATYLVNCIGCLLIGLLIGFFQKNQTESESLKLLFITGFCGGFTTFSTFGLENYNLLQTQNYITSLLYIASSILIGIAFVGIGIYLTK
ncbi:MAG: fluoride efflux transporter CrcB [Flavobacterium sp.]|nr:fluoride efflux transporter CrcB [Flavobacterium sp.]